jgi:hypothetical protein
MDTNKAPDRLNCSALAWDLLNSIDKENYFSLGIDSINRSQIFLFAMSLGIESKTKSEIKKAHTGGLILDSSISSRVRAAMYSQFIMSLQDPENELNAITNKSDVYKMAEQYANTGFEILKDYYENRKAEDLVIDLFMELDKQYEEIEEIKSSF